MTEFDENATIGRIIELRKDFAGPRGKSKFAKSLGISPSTYNYYENNRLPPIPVLLKICEVAGADLHWLLTGRLKNGENADGLDTQLYKKLTGLLQSSPQARESILAFTELLSEKKAVEKRPVQEAPKPKSDRPGWIPILGRTAAGMVHFWQQTNLPSSQDAVIELDQLVEKHIGRAIVASSSGDIAVDLQIGPLIKTLKTGTANLIQVSGKIGDSDSDQIVQFVECRQVYELFPDAFALQIDGDSMAPRIEDGDIVILSPSVPAAQGHIAVAHVAGQIGVTCKLIRTTETQVHLIPINEKYETRTVDRENLEWALAVLCHVKV